MCEGLWRNPCECQAELGDMARTAEVCFVGRPLWDLCECQAEVGDMAKRSETTVISFFPCR